MRETHEVLWTGACYQVVALKIGRGCPLLEFLDELGKSAPKRENKAMQLIERVAEHGPPRNVQKGHMVHQEHNLYVLKPDQQVRLVYFLDHDARPKRLVITHGFFKTKQDIPRNEKDRALEARGWYQEQKRGER